MNILNIPIDVIGYMSAYLPDADLLTFAMTHKDWLGLLKTRDWKSKIAQLAPEKMLPHLKHNAASYLRAQIATNILNSLSGKKFYNYYIDGDKVHKAALISVSDPEVSLYMDTDKLESVYGGGHSDIRMTLRFTSCVHKVHLTMDTVKIRDLLWYLCYFHPETLGFTK